MLLTGVPLSVPLRSQLWDLIEILGFGEDIKAIKYNDNDDDNDQPPELYV